MFRKPKPAVQVSEPDLQAALVYLRSLPFRLSVPEPWDRQQVLGLIREAVGSAPEIDDCIEFAPGVYGIVKPFGVDLAGGPHANGRLQVWIAIRIGGTDPVNVVEL